MSRSSRYDKYIDLFGKSGDYRVRWYLQWYEENVGKDKVDIYPISNSVMTNRPDGAPANDVAVEVRGFFENIANRWTVTTKEGKDALSNLVVAAAKKLGKSTDSEEMKRDRIVWELLQKMGGTFKNATGTKINMVNQVDKITAFEVAPLTGNGIEKALSLELVKESYSTWIASGVSWFTSWVSFGLWKPSASGKLDEPATFMFPIANSKMVVHLLLESFVKNYQEIPTSNFFDQEYSTADDINMGKYRRNASGNLIDDKGNEVFIGSNYARALLQPENKCATTGFADDAKCSEYLKDCLLNKQGSVEKCKAFMKESTYWTKAANEVEAMLPELAVKTLDQFGFERESVIAGRVNIMRFKNESQWITKLAKLPNLSPSEHKAIANNSELMGYLRMLVRKVNSSPVILNPELSSEDRNKSSPNMFVGTRLFALGMKPRYKRTSYGPSEFMKFGEMIKYNNLKFAQSLKPQSGGYEYRDSLERSQMNVDSKINQTWYLLNAQYEQLNMRLKNLGKSIAPNDNNKVRELLDSLKSAELKLKHAMLYTEKYAKLLETMGHADKAQALSYDHLKLFVDKRNQYFNRVAKKQNDLISIIQSVANLSAEENEQSDIVDVRSL